MAASEKQGDGRPVNEPGLYRNPAGVEVETSSDPTTGKIQADAMIQQGFVRVTESSATSTKTETNR